MSKHIILLIGALALFFACRQSTTPTAAGKPAVLGSRSLQKTFGTDCDKPDSLRRDCARIDFSVPAVSGDGAQTALGKNLNAWTDKFLIHLLIWTDYPETDATKALSTVEAAVSRFQAIHQEAAGSVASGQFLATCTYDVLLNDGRYLTVRLNGHSFQGGNRPLDEAAIATFDAATGRRLDWNALVQDKTALQPMIETKIRSTRADAFREGFDFSPTEPPALPGAYGLSYEGILVRYQSDEILHLGGATEFVLPYAQLGANLKVAAPEVPADGASDIYTVQGDSLVIPPFEIEVRTSARAGKTLRKKKETIIVAAYFSGDPIADQDRDEAGMMGFLQTERELSVENRVARFENLKFSRATFNKLKNKDIGLLINVYSGRRSSKNNLLSCSLLDLKASQFGHKRFSLGCSMIEEGSGGQTPPVACFALPEPGETPAQTPGFLVECNEAGDMSWAGEPLNNYDELKTNLRPLLKEWKQNGKALPELDVRGCLMGSKGELLTAYEELKTELLKHPAPAAKSSSAAKPKVPSITVRSNGKITLDGKKVDTFEDLRKQLQDVLTGYALIPTDIPVQSIGTVGMGTRAEIRSIVAESIKGANWLRKKAALAALAVPVGKKLGTAVEFKLGDYRKNGSFAFIDARPLQPGGKAIDYTKTVYQKDLSGGKFADRVLGLLQYKNGAWEVLIYTIGTNTIPTDIWAKKYKAPKALFANLN